jgi:hypothetical protein
MVEGMEGGGETDSITAASAAYLNHPLKRTGHSGRLWASGKRCSVASPPKEGDTALCDRCREYRMQQALKTRVT